MLGEFGVVRLAQDGLHVVWNRFFDDPFPELCERLLVDVLGDHVALRTDEACHSNGEESVARSDVSGMAAGSKSHRREDLRDPKECVAISGGVLPTCADSRDDIRLEKGSR